MKAAFSHLGEEPRTVRDWRSRNPDPSKFQLSQFSLVDLMGQNYSSRMRTLSLKFNAAFEPGIVIGNFGPAAWFYEN